ncbi:MAG: hypothetical protein V4612_04015 [Pseudomonadota bacterium]
MKQPNFIIPNLPSFKKESPKIVLVMDEIRFDEEKKSEECFEFYWFAREYPRIYRYHIDHIEYRLNNIHKLYEHFQTIFITKKDRDSFEESIWKSESSQIYWEFESLLGAINSSLDILSRISGIAYEEQTPVSLNKFSSKKNLNGIVDIFRRAKSGWIDKMKDYRDCFVHYTPVDHRPFVTIYKLKKNLKIWCKIPINPNVREIEGFKFSRRLDVLKYSISIYHNLLNLDEEVAEQIQEMRKKGQFPKRMRNLFFVGERQK